MFLNPSSHSFICYLWFLIALLSPQLIPPPPHEIIAMNLPGPYTFILQNTVDHHRHSMNCSHYTASIIVVENMLSQRYLNYFNAIPMLPITHRQHIYYCTTWSVFDKTAEGESWSPSMVLHVFVYPFDTGREIRVEIYGRYAPPDDARFD